MYRYIVLSVSKSVLIGMSCSAVFPLPRIKKMHINNCVLGVNLCNAFVSTYHSVLAVQMKNWEPLVLGPALAMDRIPIMNNTSSDSV